MNKFAKILVYVTIIVATYCLIKNCNKSFCTKYENSAQILNTENIDTHNDNNISVNNILLGCIQGVTEFLPISSTGHMILVEHFFNKNNQAPEYREAMNAYFTIIQSGSVLAIVILFWGHIREMFMACFLKSTRGRNLIRNLAISFIPAGLLGALFDGILQNRLYNPPCIACALIFGAMIMIHSERKYSQSSTKSDTIDTLSIKNSLKIGLWQCLALIPGMSRSMTTIVGGYFCGLNKKSAAEYSFLLGFLTLSAATIFKLFTNHTVLFSYFDTETFIQGILVAFVCSLLTMRIFLSYLNKHGLKLFAWYRIVLGCAVIIFLK